MRNRKKNRSNGFQKLFIYASSRKQLIAFIRRKDGGYNYTEEELKLIPTGGLREIALILHNTTSEENDMHLS